VGVIAPARRTGALALIAALATALAVALAACARERAPAADSAGGASGARSPVAIGGAGKPTCPGTGHWSPCTVRKRLEAAGVAPQPAASLPDLPSLGATPALYTVGRSGLAIYLFADSAARSRAARALDTTRFISAAKELTMRGETTAIQSDNLLALLFSRNEQQRERVSDALTAGPPQPDKR
jgi:hypothetical protein